MASACADILSSDEEEDQEETVDEERGESSTSCSEESDEEEEEGEGAELELPQPSRPCVTATTGPRTSFTDLGIHSWLVDQLKQLQMKTPTSVQVLEGCDVLGCAKTGTGKTLAFALPILNQATPPSLYYLYLKLAIDPYGVYALILTPTRELAMQIDDQFCALGKPIGLKTCVVVGGRNQTYQSLLLSRRPHVLVATPGRLADHMESDPESLRAQLSRIAFLVIDEADRLLDGQYSDQLKTIFSFLPKKRQTLLFSATITSALNQLHKVSVKKPFFFEDKTDDEVATADGLEQRYVLCPVAVKDAYLVYVVKNFVSRHESSSVLVFTHTCRECQALALMFKVAALHSQIPQGERTASLTRFRSKRVRILICTDVASRGLDISHVDLVVNHNVPQSPKTYVHRVGRSARAGRVGSALTFVTQYDVLLLQAVEKLIGKKLEELKVNDKKVAQYVTQVLVTKREAEIKLDRENFGERRETHKRKELLMAGVDEDTVDRLLDDRRKGKRTRKSTGKKKIKRAKL